MLVCSVSQLARRAAIAADLAEAATALDAPGTGNVVFATLVDDPASVREFVDAYLGQIMLEAASASSTVTAGSAYAAALAEAVSAAATADASLAVNANIAEAATAAAAPDASAVAGFVGTTFDAASVTNVTLTNGNLTAMHTNTTSNSGARSISLKSTGKFYFEIAFGGSSHGGGDAMAIMASAATYTNVVGNTAANYVVMYRATGNIFASTTNSGKSLGSFPQGSTDVICFAVDLGAKLIWLRKNNGNWNNTVGADPATGTSGITIPGVVTYAPAVTFGGALTAANDVMTANFGAATFAFTAPSGFTTGWPA